MQSDIWRTSLPENATSSDPRIIAAFKELDNILFDKQTTAMLRRFAYIQLLRVFETHCQLRPARWTINLNPGYRLPMAAAFSQTGHSANAAFPQVRPSQTSVTCLRLC